MPRIVGAGRRTARRPEPESIPDYHGFGKCRDASFGPGTTIGPIERTYEGVFLTLNCAMTLWELQLCINRRIRSANRWEIDGWH